MGLAAFNRMRREQAAREAAAALSVSEEEKEPVEAEIEGVERPLSPDDVEDLEIDKVKELLDQCDIKFAHNTSEKKLRDKLKDAIK